MYMVPAMSTQIICTHSSFYRKLSTLAILPYLSLLCFHLGMIVFSLCVILEFEYKFTGEDTGHYLASNL